MMRTGCALRSWRTWHGWRVPDRPTWPGWQDWRSWRFPDRARNEIGRLGVDADAIRLLELFLARVMRRDDPAFKYSPAAPPTGLLPEDAAHARIAALAGALAQELEGLALSGRARRLGEALAHYQPPDIARALDEAGTAEYRATIHALGPGAYTDRLERVRELAAAAHELRPPDEPARRGRPAARDHLLQALFDGLDLALSDEARNWRRDWASLTAPKGQLVRLVAIVLEVIGEPITANPARMVARALRREAVRLAREGPA